MRTGKWARVVNLWTLLAGAALVFAGGCDTFVQADPQAEIAALRKEGVIVRVDEKGNAQSVHLTRAGYSDRTLAHVRRLETVEELDLLGTRVTAEGLAALKGHPKLHTLILEDNYRITDAGLAHLKDLPALKSLKLRRVSLPDPGYGPLRDEALVWVGQLTNLEELEVSGAITDAGLTHLKGLTKLRRVVLATEMGPAYWDFLKGLPRLEYLRPGPITDETMAELKQLHSLKDLDLSAARITDRGMADLGTMRQLTRLNLPGTRVSRESLVHLRELTNLECLSLRGQHMGPAELGYLKGMKHLKRLNLAVTQLDERALSHFPELPELEFLNLNRAIISGRPVPYLTRLRNLKALVLDGDDETLGDLDAMPGLTSLVLRGDMTNAGLAHLASHTQLRRLLLQSPAITDDGLVHLAALTNLEELSLVKVNITDAGLAHLADLRKLRYLDLSETPIGDLGLAHLHSMTDLQWLFLRNDRGVTDAALVHLKGLPNLQFLDLLGAKVTVEGAKTLGETRALQAVSFSPDVGHSEDPTVRRLSVRDWRWGIRRSGLKREDLPETVAEHYLPWE